MPDYMVERVLDVKAEVGESPAWSVHDQALYWVDIHKSTINRLHAGTGLNTSWTVPAMPGCFAFREAGGAVIAARDGFYDIDFGTGAIERILDEPFNKAIFRFNDGRTDRQGRFCVGSMANLAIEGRDLRNSPFHGTGILYRFDGDKLMPIVAPLAASNGTAFSPDGRILYHADTRGRLIYAHDYDPETGTASGERIFARVPETLGLPDGACVDAAGGYWTALPAGPKGGSVARFAPDGTLDLHIETPTPVPTMPAFGGPKMSTLYITSARIERYMGVPEHPLSGDIFAVETDFQGLPEIPFVSRRHK